MSKKDATLTSHTGNLSRELMDDDAADGLRLEVSSLHRDIIRLTNDRDQLHDKLSGSLRSVEQLETVQKSLLAKLDTMEDMILSVLNNE